MKKILAFAGSNSSTSINHRFVSYVSQQMQNHSVEVIKLTDFPLPIFSENLERETGYPENLKSLLSKIKDSDALIISVNEHNGSVSAFFKNSIDWLSRIEHKFLKDKKILLLSTSPGKRGGLTALEYTASVFPRFDAEVIAKFALPSFFENMPEDKNAINDSELAEQLGKTIQLFITALE